MVDIPISTPIPIAITLGTGTQPDQHGNKYSLKNAHMVQATVPVEQRAKNAIRNLASLKMENYLKVVNLRRINYVFRSSKL